MKWFLKSGQPFANPQRNSKCALLKPATYNFATMNPTDDLQSRWWQLEAKFMDRFGKKPDMETILMLIGIQELHSTKQKFSKEQKQDLMHIAVCTLLSQSGYYILEKYDEEGWPHFAQAKELPAYDIKAQEEFLKDHILLYFESQEREITGNS